MGTSFWGPKKWFIIHYLSYRIEQIGLIYGYSTNTVTTFWEFIYLMMVCSICKDNLSKKLIALPPSENGGSKTDNLRLSWKYHVLVNMSLGKKSPQFRDIKPIYEKNNPLSLVRHLIFLGRLLSVCKPEYQYGLRLFRDFVIFIIDKIDIDIKSKYIKSLHKFVYYNTVSSSRIEGTNNSKKYGSFMSNGQNVKFQNSVIYSLTYMQNLERSIFHANSLSIKQNYMKFTKQ